MKGEREMVSLLIALIRAHCEKESNRPVHVGGQKKLQDVMNKVLWFSGSVGVWRVNRKLCTWNC